MPKIVQKLQKLQKAEFWTEKKDIVLSAFSVHDSYIALELLPDGLDLRQLDASTTRVHCRKVPLA